ncbi:MAG: glycosyltransferase family 39 protein [Deltaproteobacteria bacterium]|nr:glycosyltransferase family 39 protein [Deltaproteobacteria bacterium]
MIGAKRTNLYFLLILALAIVLRCQGLFNPLLDKHSWRQTDTAAVAYNYYTSGLNIFQPRLDVLPEIRELEFHLYPYTVALLYTLFGFHEVWGRVVSILCGLGTLWFIFLLTRKYVNETSAFYAAFFWASSPMAVFYNRAFLPESMMLVCSAAGMYWLLRWSETEEARFLLLSAGLLSGAILIKLTSLYLSGPVWYVLWQRLGKKIFSRPSVYLFGLVALVPPLLWYGYQHQLFKAASWGTSIFDIGNDKWFNQAILLNPDFYQKVWLQYLGEQHFAFTGYAFLFVGWVVKLPEKAKVFGIWMGAVFAYILLIAVGNYVHEYYQLVVLIPGSVLVGRGMALCLEKTSQWKNPAAWLLTIAAVAWLPVCGYTKSLSRMKFDITYQMAGESLAAVSGKQDRALVISDGQPEVLYYAHRKGWHLEREKYSLAWVNWYIAQGVQVVVVKGKEQKELTRLPQDISRLEKSITLEDQSTIDELKKYLIPVKQTNWFWIFRTNLPESAALGRFPGP